MKKKLFLTANELTDVSAVGISLVKHGANRTPIKLIKSAGGDMKFDLSKLFKSDAKSDGRATLVSVLCKADDQATVTEKLNQLGISPDTFNVNDGIAGLMVSKSDGEVEYVKLNDHVSIGVVGLKKGFSSYSETTNFMEAVLIEGFYPGVRVAFEAMMSALHTLMWEAAEPPVAETTKLIDDYASYMKAMVASLPVIAFKMESMSVEPPKPPGPDELDVKKAEVEDAPQETPKTVEEPDKVETTVETQEEKPAEATPPAEVIPPVETAPEASPPADTVEKSESTQKFDLAVVESILQKVEAAFEKNKTDLEATVTTLLSRIEKTEKAINGVVSMHTVDPDLTKLKKKDASSVFGSALSFPGYTDK